MIDLRRLRREAIAEVDAAVERARRRLLDEGRVTAEQLRDGIVDADSQCRNVTWLKAKTEPELCPGSEAVIRAEAEVLAALTAREIARLEGTAAGRAEMRRARGGGVDFGASQGPVLSRCRELRDMGVFPHHRYGAMATPLPRDADAAPTLPPRACEAPGAGPGAAGGACGSGRSHAGDLTLRPPAAEEGVVGPLTASVGASDEQKFSELLCGTCLGVHSAELSTYWYEGCFADRDGSGVDDWRRGLTWTECEAEASRRGAPWFVMEFPQGYPVGSFRANCGMGGSYRGGGGPGGGELPPAGRIDDEACHGHAAGVDFAVAAPKLGRLLGGANAMAVYRTAPEFAYVGCYARSSRRGMALWTASTTWDECARRAARERRLWFVVEPARSAGGRRGEAPAAGGPLVDCGFDGDYSVEGAVDGARCGAAVPAAAGERPTGGDGVFAAYHVRPTRRRSRAGGPRDWAQWAKEHALTV
jgi:hypothetical protein